MQKSRTKNYNLAVRKHRAIETVFNPNNCKRIVGLAGPQPVQCVKRWIKSGFEHITVYENDIDTFIKQQKLLGVKYPDINIVCGDILDIEPMDNVFYDIDLCCTVKNLRNIHKFKENFMLTLCLRGHRGGLNQDRESVERTFLEMRNEELRTSYNMIEEKYGLTVKEIVTKKSNVYHSICYRDPFSPPMLIITKV